MKNKAVNVHVRDFFPSPGGITENSVVKGSLTTASDGKSCRETLEVSMHAVPNHNPVKVRGLHEESTIKESLIVHGNGAWFSYKGIPNNCRQKNGRFIPSKQTRGRFRQNPRSIDKSSLTVDFFRPALDGRRARGEGAYQPLRQTIAGFSRSLWERGGVRGRRVALDMAEIPST